MYCGPLLSCPIAFGGHSSGPKMSPCQLFSRFSLHKITNSEDFSFSPAEFSRFKFGDDNAAQHFGTAMAEAFIQEYFCGRQRPTSELVVACSYQFIPTAAYSLRRHFLRHLNRWMAANDLLPVQKVKIYRSTTYQLDYGTLTAESRAQHIGRDHFHVDRDLVVGKTILVLDDIRITGAHENRILRMFQELGIQEPLLFLYFAELTSSRVEPGIENRLNFYDIQSIFDLEDIVQHGRFAINARFVKYVLAYEHEAFCRFLKGQDEGFAALLLHVAIGNGYHKKHEYAVNMSELSRKLCLGQSEVVAKGIELSVDSRLTS